ncbi:ATP-binding protein [Halocatena halophila]|uniref:ATP-binding protein n=1 Tax=Halocatena halophila TaxID=2814576 RepID=UPI002ED076C7
MLAGDSIWTDCDQRPKSNIVIIIIVMLFHDRTDELTTLREQHDRDSLSMVVIYGRRRVGKTELVKKVCEETDSIYHLATKDAPAVQQRKLLEELAAFDESRVPRHSDWHDVMEYLGEILCSTSPLIAIDEFPYQIESDEAVLGALQTVVDGIRTQTDGTLILCGSSIGVMESDVLGRESPLFGRRSGQIDLQPFSFSTANEVIEYSFIDSIRTYAVAGGMPMYLMLFDYAQPLADNLLQNHLSKTSILFSEPEFLLRSELREPSRYMSILESIALGATTPNEMAGHTGIDSTQLPNYLSRLQRLRLIERKVPVTAEQQRSKRSLYSIKDPFLRFWFRFVEPNQSGIEQAPEQVLTNRILPELDRFVSQTFEDVARECVWECIRSSSFSGNYGSVGSWWYGGEEIDIVALDDRTPSVLLGECKWTTTPVGIDLVDQLTEKAGHVRWKTGARDEEYAIFSRAGFEDGVRAQCDDRWHLFDLNDMQAVFEAQ